MDRNNLEEIGFVERVKSGIPLISGKFKEEIIKEMESNFCILLYICECFASVTPFSADITTFAVNTGEELMVLKIKYRDDILEHGKKIYEEWFGDWIYSLTIITDPDKIIEYCPELTEKLSSYTKAKSARK